MIYDIRECYRGGIVKPYNRVYEFHAFCECEGCKFRYKHNNQRRNQLTVTTDSKDKFRQVEKFVRGWRCKNGNKEIPTEYVNFIGNK